MSPGGLRLAVVVAAVAVGGTLRLAPVGDALLFGDEFHSLREMRRGYLDLLTQASAYGSGMALPLLQRALADLFGANHWTLRAPAYLASLATLVGVYALGRRRIGPGPAAAATALLAVSSVQIYYAHFGRAYALMSLLFLLLVAVLQRAVDRGRADLRSCVAAAVLAALLPYVHLASAGPVVLLFAAAGVAFAAGRLWRDAGRVALALVAGGGACLLAHLPAWDSLSAYLEANRSREYFGDFAAPDVLAILVGSRSGGLIAAGGVALSALAWLRRRGWNGLPLVAGCLGPGLFVAVARPYGDAYAWARYAVAAVPAACWLVAWGLDAALGRWLRDGVRRETATLVAGVALAALLHASGPLGVRHTPDGPHANTYIRLYPLPHFDRPWPDMPDFYRQLAEDPRPLRIVEAPALTTRARHLYRSYFLTHGKPTQLAVTVDELRGRLPAGYVSLDDPTWRDDLDADYLILHLDVRDEARRYSRYVYADESWRDPSVVAYMTRHSRFSVGTSPPPGPLRDRLEARLGAPVFDDGTIRVWKLR